MDIQKIKERINCIDYAQRIGLDIRRPGDRCTSPLRTGAKNKTSFVVYEDFFYDFGLAKGGDIIDFNALYSHDGDRGAAIRELAKFTGIKDDYQTEEWVEYTQNLNNKIAKWHSQLTADDYKYLHSRGINDDTIKAIRIGRTNDGRLCIPYYKNGYVAYYITRYMEGGSHPESKYMKMKVDDFNEHIPWGMETLTREGDTLVIAEGMFDILSFYQEGYPCLSAITGHFSKNQLPTVLQAVRNFKRVFLIYDNDVVSHAGEKFTIKMAKILMGKRIPFIVGKVPRGYKDVSEYYADGGEIQALLEEAEDGTDFLCGNITDEEEFKVFVKKVTRYMEKSDTIALFNRIKKISNFNEEWLNELKKECTQPPSENFIANEVMHKYTLLYNPRIGFFEFNGKYWIKQSDETIMKYIGDEFGVYRTGSKLSSTLKIVKADVTTDVIFNTGNVINFVNGTLDLTAKEPVFREHSREDYCTYCLPYPYDETARCDQWIKFIESVTDFDDMKISLLQEICGYVLYTDNRLQKSFVLIGGGANGKSVFLNTITKVFGKENISNVEMSSLAKDFQAIHLMTSMLNISAETRTDVSGAESIFKQIVAGDSISSCYKGKDYISFVPRAKMFISCNEYIKSKDTTDGWLRRFCFVRFPLKFVEEPRAENERLIDKDIEDRLGTELSGIFNWVLQGYLQLKVTGYFTEPDDHKETMEEFKESINPLICFVKEFDIIAEEGKISNEAFYKEYKTWCEEAGHKPLSRQTFLVRAKKVMGEYKPNYTSYRTNKSRGYMKNENI